jgi:hypothetical protein
MRPWDGPHACGCGAAGTHHADDAISRQREASRACRPVSEPRSTRMAGDIENFRVCAHKPNPELRGRSRALLLTSGLRERLGCRL